MTNSPKATLLFHGSMFLFILLLLAASPALHAGEFNVTPVRLDLDQNARTGSITVGNEDPEKPIQLQMRLFSWVQDETGADKLEESNDLAYFPRMMNIPPKEQRLLRAGIKQTPSDKELAYRLFIEEIPDATRNKQSGPSIAVAIRFGVPVFVKASQEVMDGQIEYARLSKGKLQVKVANHGNTHFRIEKIQALMLDAPASEVGGWYLLPGSAKEYTLNIPPETCKKASKLEILVKADRLNLNQVLPIDKNSCS